MPRPRKESQTVEAEAAATFEGWDVLDEASKRRIRNRLSQRHFRERKSLYIKSLERASKATSQTESARNKSQAKEIMALRASILNIRAQILKLSCSLNSVGAELSTILNVHGSENDSESIESDGDQPTSDSSNPSDENSHSEITTYAPCLDGQIEPAPVQSDSELRHVKHSINSSVGKNLQEPTDIQPRPRSGQSPQGHSSQLVDGGVEDASDLRMHPVVLEILEQEAAISYDEFNAPEAFSATFFTPPNTKRAVSSYESAEDVEYIQPANSLHVDVPTQSHDNVNQRIPQELQQQQTSFFSHSVPAQTNLSLSPGHFPPSYTNDFENNCCSSTFARHIERLELQVRCQFDAAPDTHTRQVLIRSCSAIMSLFVQNAWSPTFSVWFKSQVPEIIGPILLWRISPSYDTYNLLGGDYKPTELQLSVPHSAVIDWIPYSEMRDRVIMYYNDSVVLDRLLCDMMNSYVIEVPDLSRILPQAPGGRAYFGIWNIFRAIDVAFETQSKIRSKSSPPAATGFSGNSSNEADKDMDNIENPFGIYNEFALTDQSPSTCEEDYDQDQNASFRSKPFNLVEILTTPASVLKLSHDIRLYASKSWRLDRTLFDKYPELKFDGYESIIAKGRSCRIPTAPPDGPKEMTPEMMQIYQRSLAAVM